MKKSKVFVIILTILLLCFLSTALMACDLFGGNSNNGGNENNNNSGNGNGENTTPPTHTHNWSDTYSMDEINHWFACNDCDEKKDIQAHTFEYDGDDEQHWAICSVCDYEKAKSDHNFKLKSDDQSHWFECSDCGQKTPKYNHDLKQYSDADYHCLICTICEHKKDLQNHNFEQISDNNHHWKVCSDCDYITTKVNHSYELKYNSVSHWQECECGEKGDALAHSLVQNSDDENHWQECECEYKTEITAHTWSDTYLKNYTHHWFECSGCNRKKEFETHNFESQSNDDFHWNECACGEKKNVTAHTWSDEYSINDTHHWLNCTKCDMQKDLSQHTFTSKSDEINHFKECECGYKTGLESHSWDGTYAYNETHHWYNCNGCDEKINLQHHNCQTTIDGNIYWLNCLTCGYSSDKMQFTIGLEYQLNSDKYTYSVVGIGTATDQDIIIPSFYDNKPVTSIGDSAFKGCRSITSVTIPDSVTSINRYAFNNCGSLTSVTIGDSVTSIGDSAFSGCSSLTSVTIPDSVTSIDRYAFSACGSLTSVTIGDSVTSIGDSAFSSCTSLQGVYITDIASWCNISFGNYYSNPLPNAHNLYLNGELVTDLIIPNGVTRIGEFAFNSYTSITNVTIPNSVTCIGNSTFGGCNMLETATVPLFAIDYLPKNSIKTIVITNGNSIGGQAFKDYINLTSITIPESITSIGYRAFYQLFDLQYVNISNIAAWCNINFDNDSSNPLYYAKNLYLNGELVTNLVIPDGVTSIGKYAFYNCRNLTSVTIPNSVTTIGKFAFEDCVNLISMTLPFIGESKNAIDNTRFYHIGNNLNSLKNVTITNVESINSNAFYDWSNITSITIPDTVTSIGECAFYGCSSLCSITIPDSVTSIGILAFGGCNSLQEVYITDIDAWCNISFEYTMAPSSNPLLYAHNLYLNGELVTDLVIPNSVTSISSHAFNNCTSITSVTIPNSVTSIGDYVFYDCTSLTSVTIPESVTSIGGYAFYGCSSLTSITIPNSVTSIGESAFNGCKGLTIYCEMSSKPSGWDSDWNGYSPVVWDCNNNEITDDGYIYAVIDGVRYSLKDNTAIVARQPSSISGEIIIPESVEYNGNTYKATSIGEYAFSGCSNLTRITIPDGVTSIVKYAFNDCNNLNSITVPNSVTSIGDYAFYDCTSLTSITIPNSVTSIGSNAFYGCSSLTIYCEANSKPSGWDSWWNYSSCPAVWDCNNNDIAGDGYIYAVIDGVRYSLKDNTAIVARQPSSISGEIIIPESVEYNGLTYSVASIINYAFWNCTSLTSITIPDSVTSIGKDAFEGCSSLYSITIPNSVTSIDTRTFYRCTSLTTLNYNGTMDNWKAINKGSDWNYNTGNYTIICTDGKLDKNGNVIS